MELIPLDAGLVRGSHGRIPEDPGQLPLFMTSEPRLLKDDTLHATEVFETILDHVFAQ